MNPLERIPGLAEVRGGAFYLHGDDEFRKEEVARALMEAHLDPATRDFNMDMLRGTEVDSETLASVLGTPPMMAEWRVVMIREVEGLASSKRNRDILLKTVESPPPGLALVLSCTVPSRSKAKFYKELRKAARDVEFKALSPADVPGWLMERAEKVHEMQMDVEAARALGAAIGTNLGMLAREMEKLADFVGERATVTVEDVKAAGTELPSQDRWSWFDMVGEKRFAEALDALEILFAQGESGVGLVIGLTTHLLRLGVVAEEGTGALQRVLPSHQRWLAKRLGSQGRRWSGEEIDGALEGLLRVDRLLKASPLPDEHFVEEWLLGLMARREAA